MNDTAGGSGARVFPVPPPLYYGAALGIGLRLQRRWPLDVPAGPVTAAAGAALLTTGVLLTVRKVVIDPEEAYLARRFRRQYADYRVRVRRWL